MTTASTSGRQLPASLSISDGSIEMVKWIALVLMTLDHVNKHLFHGAYPALFDAGRLVMPLFGIVLAYNLARPGSATWLAPAKVLPRLVVAGAVATVPYMLLGGLAWGWWPLNIMFTLAVATGVILLLARGGTKAHLVAAATFIVGGAFVEFWWPGVAVVVAAWGLFTGRPAVIVGPVAAGILGWTALQSLNLGAFTNVWALAAIPLLLLMAKLQPTVPRVRWVFYAFYPAHLLAIWLLRVTAVPLVST